MALYDRHNNRQYFSPLDVTCPTCGATTVITAKARSAKQFVGAFCDGPGWNKPPVKSCDLTENGRHSIRRMLAEDGTPNGTADASHTFDLAQ